MDEAKLVQIFDYVDILLDVSTSLQLGEVSDTKQFIEEIVTHDWLHHLVIVHIVFVEFDQIDHFLIVSDLFADLNLFCESFLIVVGHPTFRENLDRELFL